ncbi:uncharacterized protein [Dysidea avara]|uniref:uncharacterized protein isoform X2 n=1 Tax=Dysidea avara TaxID=196820 RepID=UPI0033285FEB
MAGAYDRPSLKDLYVDVSHGIAAKWRDLGVLLLNPPNENVFNIIEKNHPQDVLACCKCMLQKWLDTKPDASWNQLLEALRSPCVQLNSLADQIDHKLKEKNKSTPAHKDCKQVTVKLTNFDKIEVEFAKMTTRIKEALHKNNISVAVLVEQLCAVSAVSNKKVPIFDEDMYEKITSVDELWRKLKNFWNIFDYDLLILVIDLTECEEAQDILDEFLAKIDLSALEDVGLVLHYKIYQEELTQPVMRIKVNSEKCTIDVKNKVKKIVSKKFNLQEYALYFKGIKEGCFELFYHVSQAVVSYLLEFNVSGSNMDDFAYQNIMSIQINDHMLLKVSNKVTDDTTTYTAAGRF